MKSLIVPGGILLLVVAVLTHSGWMTLAAPAVSFLYYCSVIGGMLLAWKFHSTRILLALLVVFLAEQALGLAGAPHIALGTPAWTALQAVALLVPLNFILIALMHDRGFSISNTAPALLFLFAQTVVVAVICRAAETSSVPLGRPHHVQANISLPGYAWLALAVGGLFLLSRALLTRKPADSALFWSLAAFSLSLRFLDTTRFSSIYSAAAACILATSIIENSYLLAYHDELTTLPSRRAFNDALLRLQEPYSIAVVDIDHFKRFNDTHGHDVGDQVLRLVATNLSQVTGGGEAYRCGGEEFAILFPGKTMADTVVHLEKLRGAIETSEFHTRGIDRRQVPRGPDRRNDRSRGRARKGHAIRQLASEKPQAALSVTVSIGVAACTEGNFHPDEVLQAADKALYRAKANGRNRVETAPGRRSRARAAGIA